MDKRDSRCGITCMLCYDKATDHCAYCRVEEGIGPYGMKLTPEASGSAEFRVELVKVDDSVYWKFDNMQFTPNMESLVQATTLTIANIVKIRGTRKEALEYVLDQVFMDYLAVLKDGILGDESMTYNEKMKLYDKMWLGAKTLMDLARALGINTSEWEAHKDW